MTLDDRLTDTQQKLQQAIGQVQHWSVLVERLRGQLELLTVLQEAEHAAEVAEVQP